MEIDGKRLAAPRAGAVGGLWAWDMAAVGSTIASLLQPASGDGSH